MDLPWKPDGFPDGWIDLRWLVNSATANDRRGDNRAFLARTKYRVHLDLQLQPNR